MFDIYADGSCDNKTGEGGWGFVVRDLVRKKRKSFYGNCSEKTTNNRMELMAVIKALEFLTDMQGSAKHKNYTARITSDSQYVINGVTKWSKRWEQSNWDGVANKDLWQRLILLNKACSAFSIEWLWVRGHNGHLYNELADKLANRGRLTKNESDTC